jgi:hypothetical protein
LILLESGKLEVATFRPRYSHCRSAQLSRSLTRGFLEYSQARGFLLDPARVRHP